MCSVQGVEMERNDFDIDIGSIWYRNDVGTAEFIGIFVRIRW